MALGVTKSWTRLSDITQTVRISVKMISLLGQRVISSRESSKLRELTSKGLYFLSENRGKISSCNLLTLLHLLKGKLEA